MEVVEYILQKQRENNEDEYKVEEYLNQKEKLAESVKQRISKIQPDLSHIRSRLLSQKNQQQ